MAGQSAGKANEKNRNQEAAGRLKYLREYKFETQGFKSVERADAGTGCGS